MSLSLIQAEAYRTSLRRDAVKSGMGLIKAWLKTNLAAMPHSAVESAVETAFLTAGVSMPVGANGEIFANFLKFLDDFFASDAGKMVLDILKQLLMGLIA